MRGEQSSPHSPPPAVLGPLRTVKLPLPWQHSLLPGLLQTQAHGNSDIATRICAHISLSGPTHDHCGNCTLPYAPSLGLGGLGGLVDACFHRCQLTPGFGLSGPDDDLSGYLLPGHIEYLAVDVSHLLGDCRVCIASRIMTSPAAAGVKRSYAAMAFAWDGQPQNPSVEPRPTSRPFSSESRGPVYPALLHAAPAISAGPSPGGKAFQCPPAADRAAPSLPPLLTRLRPSVPANVS